MTSSASANPTVRDHRGRRRPPPPPPNRYDYDQPREAPPLPRVERVGRRPGYVWVQGDWNWHRGRGWVWNSGHWEKTRGGHRWRAVRWEHRNGVWVRINGGWEADPVSAYPTSAPPPLRVERVGRRPNQVFVRGHWDWRNGRWNWTAGHWEHVRRGHRHREGRWEHRAGRWTWVAGGWEPVAANAPRYDDGPTSPPPPPRVERYGRKDGFIWARGHYVWRNGRYDWVNGHWERPRANRHWVDARWERRGRTWVFIEGGWR